MTNLCDVCGKPATQSMLRDLFGKSDERRFVCSDHGFRMRDPADVAEIERLRAALAMVVKYGAAMGTAQWDVCRRALGNEQTGNEPLPVVSFPLLPIDPKDEALVDNLVAKRLAGTQGASRDASSGESGE